MDKTCRLYSATARRKEGRGGGGNIGEGCLQRRERDNGGGEWTWGGGRGRERGGRSRCEFQMQGVCGGGEGSASDEVGKGGEVDGRMTQRYTRNGRNTYARVLNCSWFLWLTPTCARKSRWRRQRLALAITHASLCWIKRRATNQWQAPHAHHL